MADLTDREILEACARACEIELKWDGDFPYRIKRTGNSQDWNPIENDGDCARMENMCGVIVDCSQGRSQIPTWTWQPFNPFISAERRRASCLVVARAQIEKEKGGA